MYPVDQDCCDEYKSCKDKGVGKYFRREDFLFRENKLCVPSCSLRELLVRESHGGGLMGHFGVAKTLSILQEHFYWWRLDARSKTDRVF